MTGSGNFRGWLKHGMVLCLGGLCLLAFAKVIIGSFADWNFPAEMVLFDAINHFWQDNFHFFRLPHFDWHSDFLLYPYGLDVTFINWGFEMSIFASVVQRLGILAWGQWYYLFSLALTFFGTYLLLWRRKGCGWALFFSFALAFCNYAAICKFPGHYALCIVHWGILSVLLDVILVEKFWAGEHLSARFVLTKVLFLLLCLGLELGYIAGFACFSFFVVCCFLLVSKFVQTRSIRQTGKWIAEEFSNVVRTFPCSRWNFVLLFLLGLVAWVYLPIICQIMTHTPAQEGTVIWPTNPLRIFHPILPWYNPATTSTSHQGLMGRDVIDTIYAWSAGLSALLFCCLGIVFGGVKGIRKWFPFVLILLAVLFIRQFPIATYFPAFKYARIPERFSPYLGCLLLVPLVLVIRPKRLGPTLRRTWILSTLAVAIVWAVEFGTAYSHTFPWKDSYKITPFASDYRKAVEVVQKLPGEALFFIPFSAHGGDGRGFENAYHSQTAYQMQFSAKCGKKMNGCYIGRMFPDLYLKDFDRLPWMLFVDGRKWTLEMWSVLKDFFKATDFAACVVDRSALRAEQYADIVKNIGSSAASFDLHGQRYEVLPLSAELRGGKKDMNAVLNLELISSLTPRAVKLSDEPIARLISGFSTRESWGVWSMQRECVLRICLPQSLDGQRVIVNAQAFVRTKHVDVYSGSRKLAEWNVVVPPMTPADYVIDVPTELAGRTLELRLVQDDVVAPCEVDPANGDRRTLGMGLISMRLGTKEQ